LSSFSVSDRRSTTIPGRFDSLGAVTDDEVPPPTAAMHSDPAGLAPSETTKNREKEKYK